MWIEEQTLESRAMINNDNFNNNEQNYSDHQVDQEIVDMALNNNQDVQVLPNEMFEVIIRIALQQDPLSRFRLQQVNQFFKHVVEKVEPLRLYLDPDLYGNLITFPISVRRMIQVSGSGSGLVTEVKQLLNNSYWANAWLFLKMVAIHGWYIIVRVWYRKRNV
jgi:hypothetical protein